MVRPGEEEFGRAALPDDARQDGAGAHVAAGEADAVEQERDLGVRAVPMRMSDAIARIAPAPAQTPSTAATIGCGAGAHRLDQPRRSCGEGEQPLRVASSSAAR
jgi:hypothetical protein